MCLMPGNSALSRTQLSPEMISPSSSCPNLCAAVAPAHLKPIRNLVLDGREVHLGNPGLLKAEESDCNQRGIRAPGQLSSVRAI